MKKLFPLIFILYINIFFAQIPCSTGIAFDGSEDFISPDDTDAINLQNVTNRTIEFWFKTDNVSTKQVLYKEGGGTHAILIYLEDERIYLGAYRNSGTSDRRFFRSSINVDPELNDIKANKWYHVALTLQSGNTLKWFLNGVEKGSQIATQVNSHTGNVVLGKTDSSLKYPLSLDIANWGSETYNGTLTGNISTSFDYKGNISLFRIWNNARTVTEINDYKSTFLIPGAAGINGDELVAYSDQDRIYYKPNGATEISLTAFVALNTQYTTIPNTDAINLQNTRDRTIEFRFKATDMNTRQVLFEEGGATNAITAFIEGGRFYFGAYRLNATLVEDRRFFRSGETDIVFNTWYHVALTLEDITGTGTDPDLLLKWYLDGVLQDTQDGMQINSHSGNINIGKSGGDIRFPDDLTTGSTEWVDSIIGTSNSQTFNSTTGTNTGSHNFLGDFELFRIWNVARTQTEIDTNKNTLLTSGTSLVLYQSGTQMNYQPNNGSSITASADAVGVITWDGSDSNDWTTTTNWVGDTAPDADRKQKVAIPDGGIAPVLTTEISVGFLTINSGAEITIQEGATLHVYYGLDNNGTITIADGGSLIYHNCNSAITGSGTFNVIRDTRNYGSDNTNFYSYWSSPVTNATISTVFPDAETVYQFDASNTDADWSPVITTTAMQPAIGYAIQNEGTGGQVRTFGGIVNEGGLDVTMYFNTNESAGETGNVWSPGGDNLAGNPYPSAIDWDLVIDDYDNKDIEGTIYFWNQQNSETGNNNVDEYYEYNKTGSTPSGLTGKIGTAQAFFIRVNNDSVAEGATTILKLKATHQVAGDNVTFYKSNKKSEISDKLKGRSWFRLKKENTYNSILIGFVNGATEKYDRLYDGPFDINQKSLGFYSLVEEDKKASIQGLPKLIEDEKIVTLGFVVDETGEYSIKLQEEYINDSYYIYLEDTEANVFIDLKEQEYTFTLNTIGENNSRFKIVYSKEKKKTLNIDKINSDELNFSIYVNNAKQLIVDIQKENQIKEISLFNVLGRKIATFSTDSIKDVSNLTSGIYLVKAALQDNTILSKKIIITN